MRKPDGGPAFPDHNLPHRHNGMSLRDYFAAQALTGLLAAMAHPSSNGAPNVPEANAVFVEHAYAMADAMISEREK